MIFTRLKINCFFLLATFISINFLFSSCGLLIYGSWAAQSHGVRTYTNGKKINNNNQKYESDSILVLGVNEQSPDSSYLIASTEMHSAAFLKVEEPYAVGLGRSLSYAKFEAHRLGANLIKIKKQQPLKNRLYVDMFKLPLSSCINYKSRIDSLNYLDSVANKGCAIVHIKSNLGNPKIKLYYDDSLVGNTPRMFMGVYPLWWTAFCPIVFVFEIKKFKEWKKTKKYYLKDGEVIYHPTDLKFRKEGYLKLDKKSNNNDKHHSIYLANGKEYFLYIFYSLGRQTFGPYFRQVTEEEYRLNELKY